MLKEKMHLFAMPVVLIVLIGAASATVSAQRGPAPPPSKFKISIPAFRDGARIPTKYSCADPKATSPAIDWSNPPSGTMSIAMIMHDPEAAPQKAPMDVTHWILWNIPESSMSLMADIKPGSSPDGIVQGKNIRGVDGYQPPCPPPGSVPHHYTFELYALDTKLELPAGSTREQLLQAMSGHVIGKAAYIGLFGR